jgi:hypothetical protein
MIHEFALDPGVLSNWQSFRFFIDQFGVHHGRMISRYPGKWKKMVYEKAAACGDIERKRIEAALQTIDSKLIRKERPYEPLHPWLTNAIAEHGRDPFRAVISRDFPTASDYFLAADEINENTLYWRVQREDRCQRTAVNLAEKLKPLLLVSDEILFVDPHFDPSASRYRRPLSEFFRTILQRTSLPASIEYHISAKIKSGHFANHCIPEVQRILPSSLSMHIFRWQQQSQGDTLHPRYLLTERGGIRIEHGLDESNNSSETTDISLLDVSLYNERWNDYHISTSSFQCADIFNITKTSANRIGP